MNGAESLVRTLVAGNVDVCFSNPGTSEMHFVAALDKVDGMRCVLALFEGVATGAADGFARMADRPASTLLHLGPGLANGLANMHNAVRASSPMVNIVGDHATYHRRYDAPLTSDIEGAARPFSHWIRTSSSALDVARDGADAIAAANRSPGRIATLILPADTAWNDSGMPEGSAVPVPAVPDRIKTTQEAVNEAVRILKSGGRTALFLTDPALRGEALKNAGRIAEATGARLIAQTFNKRMERGVGRVAVERLPYPIDPSIAMLKDIDNLILVGAKAPVAFFAYPGKPSVLTQPSCHIHALSHPGEDVVHSLEWLADELGVRAKEPKVVAKEELAVPTGAITVDKLGHLLGALSPEGAILVDESNTSGRTFFVATRAAKQHDLIHNLGGSIGYGLPVTIGAAIACPDRQVICLESDGSALYTLQALWTQARERTKVMTLLFSNRSYQILKGELANVGAANAGRKALDMMDLGNPDIDWVKMAGSMGVAGSRATTMEELAEAFQAGLDENGPYLVEIVL